MRIKTQENFRFLNVAVICATARGQNRYRLVWAVMINQPKLPINDKTRNDVHVAGTGVRLY